jgi:hypothetical protein
MSYAIDLDPLGSSDLAFVSCFHVYSLSSVANDPPEPGGELKPLWPQWTFGSFDFPPRD